MRSALGVQLLIPDDGVWNPVYGIFECVGPGIMSGNIQTRFGEGDQGKMFCAGIMLPGSSGPAFE
jgi:hypothetical protein